MVVRAKKSATQELFELITWTLQNVQFYLFHRLYLLVFDAFFGVSPTSCCVPTLRLILQVVFLELSRDIAGP
jgi:hypothetical protein